MEESPFGVTSRELKLLMSLSVEDSLIQLDELGGDKGLVNSLNSDATQGVHVTAEDTSARQREFGRNFIPATPPQTFLALAWEALQDKTLIALIVCAILSVTLGVSVEEDNRALAWIDGAAILGAVVIVVVVAAGNDYSKEKKFRALQVRFCWSRALLGILMCVLESCILLYSCTGTVEPVMRLGVYWAMLHNGLYLKQSKSLVYQPLKHFTFLLLQ